MQDLGAEDKGKLNIGKVPISRSNPFTQVFGDVHKNLYAFMLEELDDDVDCLLDRLNEINKNLDIEIDNLRELIGGAGPRSSGFQEMAQQLKSNTQARVSETVSERNRSSVSSSIVESSTGTELYDVLDFADLSASASTN